MRVQAVIFDMDGVLIDSELFYQERRTRFLKTQGIDYRVADYPRVVGQTFPQMWQTLFPERPFSQDLMTAYRRFCEVDRIEYRPLLRPEVQPVLKTLQSKGIRVAIASSSTRSNIRRMLNECQLAEYVELIVSGEEFVETKPHPEIYEETLRRLGCLPQACLVIEDSSVGIQAAVAAKLEVWALMDSILQPDQREAKRRMASLETLLSLEKG